MTNYQHQSLSHQHFSPKIFVEAIRSVMGAIDLDPCTSEAVNDWSVKANVIFSENGLENLEYVYHSEDFKEHTEGHQCAKVFCNPPGGKTKNQSNLKLWFTAIHGLWLAGHIEQCFFLAFNQELLGSCHKELKHIPRFHCPRIKYWSFDDIAGEFKEGQWAVYPNQKSDPHVTLRRTRDKDNLCNLWWIHVHKELLSHVGKVPANFKNKTEAEKFCRINALRWRVWTNSPTQMSTLLYLPPRTNAGWTEQVSKLDDAFAHIDGSWVIPVMPPNLGAKS